MQSEFKIEEKLIMNNIFKNCTKDLNLILSILTREEDLKVDREWTAKAPQ
jgi:hypothetical protein